MLTLFNSPTADFHSRLTETLYDHLSKVLRDAKPGHCLRITTLPVEVANELSRRLRSASSSLGADVYVLRLQPDDQTYQASASKLIEMRNLKERPLLVFVPPGELAPDSLEISTFNEIPLTDIPRQTRERLESDLPGDLVASVRVVLNYLRSRHVAISEEKLVHYYVAILANGSTFDAAGGAIYQLGLVPDFELFSDTDVVMLRLSRNLNAVEVLSDPSETLLARIQALDIVPGTIQERLYKFLNTPGRRPEAPELWGGEVASSESDSIRTLAFEFWEYIQRPEPLRPKLYIDELKLASRRDDGLKVFELKPARTLPVKWELDSDPADYPDLAHFRVEIVSTDGGTVFESPNIKVGKRAVRSYSLKNLHEQNIPDDLYFLRVRAYDREGNLLNEEDVRDETDQLQRKINESENVWFYASDEEPPEADPPRNQTVRSFLEAKLLTQFKAVDSKSDPFALKPRVADWADGKSGTRRAETVFSIQYDIQNKFSLPISTILKRVEEMTLAQPETLGRWNLDLRTARNPHEVSPQLRELTSPPQLFLDARTRVFAELHDQDGVNHLTATCDLNALAEPIQSYAHAYLTWLDSTFNALDEATDKRLHQTLSEAAICLDLDIVELRVPFGLGEEITALMIAPMHPLRLLWHLQLAKATQEWIGQALESDQPSLRLTQELRQFMRVGLAGNNLPLTIWHPRSRAYYVDAEPLTPFWQLYLPPNIKDSRAVRSQVERSLGLNRSLASVPAVTQDDLLRKFQRYLVQHPYITTLKINVFNPGDAGILRSIIESLEETHQHLNYQVRLFADQVRVEEIGQALDELMTPARQVGPSRDPFTIASRNPLFPKLKYSRGRLADFLNRPAEFEAHLSILFDSFGVRVDNVELSEHGRSSYLFGLIQEPITEFEGANGQFAWRKQLVPVPCKELENNLGVAELITQLLKSTNRLQASLAAATSAPNAVPSLQLNLQPADKELLHQIHATSDWVLIVDRNLGLEYFDGPDTGERPVYLLDFTPEFGLEGSERLLLTTRSTKEVIQLIQPALADFSLDGLPGSEKLILEMLRSLSGRLALKLISSPTQTEEALSLALARLFLEQYELLAERIVIPLDAHTDLFISARRSAELERHEVSLQRGDLLLVGCNTLERSLDLHLIEVKCRQDLGSLSNYLVLKEVIREQLDATETVLRHHFDPKRTFPDRLDRPIKSRELVELLDFYLRRAQRYGVVSDGATASFADFFESIDSGYTMRFQQVGLVFDFGAEGLSSEIDSAKLAFHRIGLDYARRMIENGLGVGAAAGIEVEAVATPLPIRERRITTMASDQTFDSVRETFKPRSTVADSQALSRSTGGKRRLKESLPEAPSAAVKSDAQESPEKPSAGMSKGDLSERPFYLPSCDIVLAESGPTPQYGLLGEVSGKTVGLDLNGCNTVSLFGVQGGGKSYTIGTIVEMAVQPIHGINALPSPLASVIFHYHESQDYPPEFVSMINPNNQQAEIAKLEAVYGADPTGLKDILLLTPADKLADRQREFPALTVEPIYFSPAELSIKDWLFLMGAMGNPSMYVHQMNIIMRRLRGKLTLAGLRSGIEESNLSDKQKELAHMRLAFAEEFIRDDQNLRQKLSPGRLIIVDLRDELIQKDQALGLFVVMLNIFSGAGQGDKAFNKLIVFDEAHKYITHSDLTAHVVESIREMRHKGVSIVLASQDPPSLPSTVIELSSVVILHKFNSPKWLSHIQKSVAVLAALTPEKMGALRPGEAFVWANKASDAVFTRQPVKMKLRPRVTLHGGTMRKAVR